MLVDLDRAFPNSKNVLFPMALCYERLGHPSEAGQLADRLLAQFQDPRAQALKARLAPSMNPVLAGGIDLNAIDIQLDAPSPSARKQPAPVSSGSDGKLKYAVFAGLAALILLGGWAVYSIYAAASGGDAGVAAYEGTVLQSILLSLAGIAVQILFTYIALRVMKALPDEDFQAEIGTVSWICGVSALPGILGEFVGLSILGLAGFILYLVLLSRKLELTCGQLVICVFIQLALGIGLGIAAAIAFGIISASLR